MKTPTKKYGNDKFWCYLETDFSSREVSIWKGPRDSETIIARAADKYEAKNIVDALLAYSQPEDKNKFGKRELSFLEFICLNCAEPYVTMASNSILWNDREIYNNLRDSFPKIYG